MEINLANFKKSVYSADDQDGIIEKIFKLIGFTNKYFVEFGSECRKNCGGNTAYLREKYKFDGVVHLAAESHVDNSITGPK